jgi:hypothetical protein
MTFSAVSRWIRRTLYRQRLGADHPRRQQRTQRSWISMPSFVYVLNGDVIFVVTTNLRAAWGNQADTVNGGNVVRRKVCCTDSLSLLHR